MSSKIGVGIIGCGNISDIYMRNLRDTFTNTAVVACSDADMGRAAAAAEKHRIPKAQTVSELLANPQVDIVLNITIPASHHDVCRQALLAGKHVYVEKPLSIEYRDARELVALAGERGLVVGCAPDTFLGGGLQTCRALVDEGAIGRPLSATAFLGWHGPEHEHPAPAFLYKHGAGPIYDYGPYYITALISMLGAAKSVCALAGKGFAERTVSCPGPMFGTSFPVETPTHVTGNIAFAGGAIATLMLSFDIWGHGLPFMEIYGSEGTLRLPDPDKFGGPVYLARQGEDAFREIPLRYGHAENSRGIGLADMADAIAGNRRPRASGDMALHVVEIMSAFLDSAERQRYVELETSCARPEPLGDTVL